MELTICLGVMRIQMIFYFLGAPWGKAKHRTLTHSRLGEKEPFHYPPDYIRNPLMLQTPISVCYLAGAATEFDFWGDQGNGKFRDLLGGPMGGECSLVIMQLSVAFPL